MIEIHRLVVVRSLKDRWVLYLILITEATVLVLWANFSERERVQILWADFILAIL